GRWRTRAAAPPARWKNRSWTNGGVPPPPTRSRVPTPTWRGTWVQPTGPRGQSCQRFSMAAGGFGGVMLRCLLRSPVKASRRQAVASPPVVEPRLLVAPQTAVLGAAGVRRPPAVPQALERPGQEDPHLRHTQRGACLFPPWSAASGARSPAAPGPDGSASP